MEYGLTWSRMGTYYKLLNDCMQLTYIAHYFMLLGVHFNENSICITLHISLFNLSATLKISTAYWTVHIENKVSSICMDIDILGHVVAFKKAVVIAEFL